MKKWFVVIILVLAFVLRVYALNKYPIGFTPDEASFGYDAYSLLTTGKDQWGHSWPLVLESFGDGKLPLYSYLSIPSVAIFGLNEFATRFPAAVFGTLAVLASYLLARKLFRDERIALLSALMLAVSPWHIALSRGAFEANLTTFFLTFGVYLFLSKKYIWSALFFGLNLFSYHSARLVTPLIIFALWYWKRKEFNFKKNILSLIVFVSFLFMAFYSLLIGGGSRAGDVTIFNPTDKWQSVYDDRYGAIFDGESYFWAKIFNNKFTYIFSQFANAYSTYLSPQFLFTLGAAETTYGMVPSHGVLYWFEFIFLIILFVKVIKGRISENEPVCFLFLWVILSIVPASLTKGPGYAANRVAVMMPAIQILSSLGAVYLYELLKPSFRKIVIVAFGTVYLVCVLFFLESYFYKSPRKMAQGMLYGREEMMKYVNENKENYENIVISRSLSEPQIYVAFYNKIDPIVYQQATKDWERYRAEKLPFLDQLGEYNLGDFTFKNVNYYDERKLKNVLIVGKPNEFPNDVTVEKVILYPNQIPAIYLVKGETNQ